MTVFVRSPEKLGKADPRLRIVKGDFTQAEPTHVAIAGQDAVLSALGTHVSGPATEISDAARRVVAAMQEEGVRRVIWITAMGITETRGKIGPIFSFIIPRVFRHPFADKERQEAIIRSPALDWTIVHAPMLTNGRRTGTYRVGKQAIGGRLLPKISRADVADFMVGELTDARHLREVVPLSY